MSARDNGFGTRGKWRPASTTPAGILFARPPFAGADTSADFSGRRHVPRDRGAHRFRTVRHIGRVATSAPPRSLSDEKMIAHHSFTRRTTASKRAELADIRGGGSPRLAAALMASRLGQRIEGDLERRTLAVGCIGFRRHPMPDQRHAGPSWTSSPSRIRTQEVMVGPGRWRRACRRSPTSPWRGGRRKVCCGRWSVHGELRTCGRTTSASGSRQAFADRHADRLARRPEQTHWRFAELRAGGS